MTVEEWKQKNPPIRRKPITNADKIRAMTDEELAGLFADFETRCYLRLEPTAICDTVNFAKQHLERLKSTAEEGEDDGA